MAKHGKKSKSKAKSKKEFADIQILSVAEVFGGIQLLSPTQGFQSPAGSPVPIDVSGFIGVIPMGATAYSFLVRIDATPGNGGLPVAIAQNVTILQPGDYTQFRLATLHFQPPKGRYRLTATIQVQGDSPALIDSKESTYDVV